MRVLRTEGGLDTTPRSHPDGYRLEVVDLDSVFWSIGSPLRAHHHVVTITPMEPNHACAPHAKPAVTPFEASTGPDVSGVRRPSGRVKSKRRGKPS